MSDATLRDLGRRVRDSPGDPEVLRGLAQLAARAERLPVEATPARVLPALAALWREDPEDRHLAPLLLALLDGELPPGAAPRAPPWWQKRDRARAHEGRAFDRRQGFPLRIRRRRDGATMVLVPAGDCIRGSDDVGPECSPPHLVTLEAFYLDRRSVSWRQWEAYLVATGQGGRTRSRRDPDDPVTGITWEQAAAYCAWVGGRLPTEAEYEKAMRGSDGWRYPWGNPRVVQVEAADAVTEVADRLVGQPELQRTPMGRLFGEVIRHGSRRLGREASRRAEEPEFHDESPFGLLGVDAPHFDWTDDWYDRDAYRDAVRHGPRPAEPPAPRGPDWTNQQWAEHARGEFDNRHDEAPPGMAEQVYQQALREGPPWRRDQRAKVVRRGSPARGRGGGHEPCARRASQAPGTGRADLGFRVAYSAARAPDAFAPPGTEPAKRMKRKADEPAGRRQERTRRGGSRRENPFVDISNLLLDFADRLRDD